jgi:hypothetical protein
MPRTIKADGRSIVVPDDATDEEINQIVGPAPAAPQRGFFSSALDSSGLSTLGHAIMNPRETASNLAGVATYGGGDTTNPIINGIKGEVNRVGGELKTAWNQPQTLEGAKNAIDHTMYAIPGIGGVLSTADNQYKGGNYAGAAGTMAGLGANLASPSLIKSAVPAVGRVISATGAAAEDAGVGLMNKTVGALKPDFKRGANPARGYFAAGNGPASSMQSLADKAASSKAYVGKQIGSTIDAATASGTKIPATDVASVLSPPIQKGMDLELGPGGMGNTASIENYSAGFRPALKKAVQDGGMTPRELFDMKRGVAQNTNWSDPSQFNLKAIRQQQSGAMSGVLGDAIPELPELNSQYGDLSKFAARAQLRAETHSMPLTSLMAKTGMSTAGAIPGLIEGNPLHATMGAAAGVLADSVPVKSTIASGLFYGGKKLSQAGNWLMPPTRTTVKAVTPYSMIGNNYKKK